MSLGHVTVSHCNVNWLFFPATELDTQKIVCFSSYGYTCLETNKTLWNNKGFIYRSGGIRWRCYLLSPVLQPLGQEAGFLIGCRRTRNSGGGGRRTTIGLWLWSEKTEIGYVILQYDRELLTKCVNLFLASHKDLQTQKSPYIFISL